MFQSTYTSWIKILQHFTFEINLRKWGMGGWVGGGGWAAHFWANRKCPWLHCSTQKISFLFLSLPTYLLNIMVTNTQKLSQIKSQDFIGHIRRHFITTSPLTYVTDGIQDFVKMLSKTSTCNPTACYFQFSIQFLICTFRASCYCKHLSWAHSPGRRLVVSSNPLRG